MIFAQVLDDLLKAERLQIEGPRQKLGIPGNQQDGDYAEEVIEQSWK